MAARATRSASRKARVTEAVATGPLGALSHDELGVVFDGLADPLQPVVAVALSSTCLGLRTPLRAALEVLNDQHEKAKALCRKVEMTCSELRGAKKLSLDNEDLPTLITTNDAAILGMILRSGLPNLRDLYLNYNTFGDAGMKALFEGLGRGAAPSLIILGLIDNQFGPAGAEALAAALRRGAMPKLEGLGVATNPLGNRGVATLAAELRKRPAINGLNFENCNIGDDGVASLVANLGKKEFKALTEIWLDSNEITDKGCAMLISALNGGAVPKLQMVDIDGNPASSSADQAVQDALWQSFADDAEKIL